MDQLYINHWAVLVCALLNLLLGAIWYSPLLFYKAWQSENKLSEDQLKKINFIKVHGLAFILALLFAYNMAFYLGDAVTTASWGATAGLLTGLGFCFTLFAIIALFELKSWRYILINGGYMIIYATLVGLILGTWR